MGSLLMQVSMPAKSDNSNLPVIENPEPKKVEFTSPTRPSPGELIVPGQDNSGPPFTANFTGR